MIFLPVECRYVGCVESHGDPDVEADQGPGGGGPHRDGGAGPDHRVPRAVLHTELVISARRQAAEERNYTECQ